MGKINPLFDKSAAELNKMSEKEVQEAYDSLSVWERFWGNFWHIPHAFAGDKSISNDGSFRILWTLCSHPVFFIKNIIFGKSAAFKSMRHFMFTPLLLLAFIVLLVWLVANGIVSFGLGDL